MAVITSSNVIKGIADGSLEGIYSENTLESAIAADLIDKQNQFNEFLDKLDAEMRLKSGKEILESVSEMTASVSKYIKELSGKYISGEQKKLFISYAEARSSSKLAKLQTYSQEKIEAFKRESVLTYCNFLLKSSKELYDDAASLNENTAYYAGYIRLLPEYAKTNTAKESIRQIYGAAINAAIENGDRAIAATYLDDKNIAGSFEEYEINALRDTITESQDEESIRSLTTALYSDSPEALKSNLSGIKTALAEGVINQTVADETAVRLNARYNLNKKLESTKRVNYAISKTTEVTAKLITGNIAHDEILNSGLSENIMKLLYSVVENDNAANSEKRRKERKAVKDRVTDGIKDGSILETEDICKMSGACEYLTSCDLLQMMKLLKQQLNKNLETDDEKDKDKEK